MYMYKKIFKIGIYTRNKEIIILFIILAGNLEHF